MDPKTVGKASQSSCRLDRSVHRKSHSEITRWHRNDSSNMKPILQPDMEDSTTSIVSRPHRASGSSGTTGAAGASGAFGTFAAAGALEAAGASGAFGTTEASGVLEAAGAFGASGTSGAAGASGAFGTIEASGALEAAGAFGAIGASGFSGTKDARVRQVERNELVLAEGASSCCRLDELKRLAECDSTLGDLTFSKTHTVLVDVSAFNRGARILPQHGNDMWNRSFVKMPCSPVDVITKTLSKKVPRWKLISQQLKGLAEKKRVRVQEVVDAIVSYNPTYKDQWLFDALLKFVENIPSPENYFSTLFPKIAALALQLPNEVQKAIPLLRTGHTATITLSQYQISCLLANAFFCTFPHRNASSPNAEYCNYPTINFSSLFGNWSDQKKEKLRAIMHYFKTVTDQKPHGLVTFERRCLPHTDKPSWKRTETLQKLHVTASGSIDNEGTGMLQVDFASSRIGGGVLSSGLVQEEILFLIYPELIVSRLFTEKLAENECLIVTGSQQFSSYSGFRENFEWAGPFEDNVERDEWRRLKRQILAIDALNLRHSQEQYSMRNIERELNKAYCGFQRRELNEPDIATGKWGCGAFKGDKQLKALIQLMAAAKAHKGLAFFTFGDEELVRDLKQIYHLLVKRRITVDKLYRLLQDYCAVLKQSGSHVDLFGFIGNTIKTVRNQL